MSDGLVAEDILTLIRSRRSVRRFTEESVSDDLIKRIIKTATYAPNAHNRQPWRFIVIKTPNGKSNLGKAMGVEFRRTLIEQGLSTDQADQQVQRSRDRITQAPVIILLCLDTSTLDQYNDPIRQQGELTMAVQSVAMAGSYLLLAAHAEKLGGVWICAPLFTPNSVQTALDLPSEWLPQGMILLGYPAVIPELRTRLPLHKISIFR